MTDVLLALIVLVVTAALSRGGRHPRLLRGGIAFAVTSGLLVLLVLAFPTSTMTSGEAYGIPLAVALVVGLVSWGRLVPLLKYPSGVGVVVAWVAAVFAFLYPVAVYVTWRYATGHRAGDRTSAGAVSPRTRPEAQVAQSVVPAATGTTKVCPDCAELVLDAARICRFCRYEFPAPTVTEVGANEEAPDALLAPTPVPEPPAPDPAPAPPATVATRLTEPAAGNPSARRRTRGLLAPALFLVVVAIVSVSVGALARGVMAGPKDMPANPAPIATTAAISTPAPTPAPSQALVAGHIEFGTEPGREDCTIAGATRRYSEEDPLYWTATFSRTVEATEATMVRLHVDGTLVVDSRIDPSRGSCLNGSVEAGHAVAGHYVLEYHVGSEVLARGEVDVLAR
jgi:hypothetical protein